MSKKFMIIDQNILHKLIKDKDNFLLFFSTENCGYCQIAKNNIEKIIDNFPDLSLYEIKLNQNQSLFKQYGVTSVPVIKIFKNAEVVYTGFGVRLPNDLYYQLKYYF